MSQKLQKKKRNNIKYQVLVSNDYILSKHDLGTQAQHLIINIAKNIQTNSYEVDLVDDININIKSTEVQKLLDISHRNLYRILKRLRDEGIEIPTTFDKNGNATRYRYTGLIMWVDYDTDTGNFLIKIDSTLKHHFIKLADYANKINYTIANEKEFYILKLKHSLRLYLMFRKIQFQSIWRVIYTVDELNTFFKSKYRNYNALNNFVLKNCIREINENTEITITYHGRKEGRAIKKIVFDVDFKDVTKTTNKKKLNPKEQLDSLVNSKILINEVVYKFIAYEHGIGTNYSIKIQDADSRIANVANVGDSLLEVLEYVSSSLVDD